MHFTKAHTKEVMQCLFIVASESTEACLGTEGPFVLLKSTQYPIVIIQPTTVIYVWFTGFNRDLTWSNRIMNQDCVDESQHISYFCHLWQWTRRGSSAEVLQMERKWNQMSPYIFTTHCNGFEDFLQNFARTSVTIICWKVFHLETRK